MSLTQRNTWEAGKLERNGSYGRWFYELALELNTSFVDLNNMVADALEALGEDKTTAFYPKDRTHFNPQGAQLHAEIALAAFSDELAPNEIAFFQFA